MTWKRSSVCSSDAQKAKISSEAKQEHQYANRAGKINQTIAASIVAIQYVVFSMPLGYSAIFLPQIRNPDEPITMDMEMESWFAAIYGLALPLGSLLAGSSIERFGRMPTIKYPLILTVIGWVFIGMSHSMTPLLIGRFIIGVSNSLVASTSQIYVSEISDPSLRGTFVNLGYVLFSVGILIMYILGALLHWRQVAWCSLSLPIVAFILLHKLPESPTWLVYHNKSEQALNVLTWLRGDPTLAKRELDDLCKRCEADNYGDGQTSTLQFFADCRKKAAFKPTVLVYIFLALLQASGTYMIVFYSVDILSELGTTVDGITMSVATSLARLCATLAFCIIYYVCRRRLIYITSGVASGICLTAAAFYLMYCADEAHSTRDFYVTCTLITIYIMANTGFLLARNTFAGEMMPARIRGRMLSYIFVILNIQFFLWTKYFQYISLYLGIQGIFLLFAAANFGAAILTYLCVPETFRRSLGEIEDYFKQDNLIYRGHETDRKQTGA